MAGEEAGGVKSLQPPPPLELPHPPWTPTTLESAKNYNLPPIHIYFLYESTPLIFSPCDIVKSKPGTETGKENDKG